MPSRSSLRSHALSTALVSAVLLAGCGKKDEPPKKSGDEEPGKPAPEDPDTGENEKAAPKLSVVKSEFGQLSEEAGGDTIDLYTLTNANGMKVGILTWGGCVTGVWVPDKEGHVANVTLHHEDMAGWEKNPSYFGASIGRYANRIDDGKFTIDDNEYQVTVNEEARGNMLHGGAKGFDKRVWDASPIEQDDAVGVELTYTSEDGEEGFPGEVATTVRYLLDDDNRLTMEYEAETTKPTPINLTNHCYWNLAGAGNGTIERHVLQLNCDGYLPVDPDTLIPTGEIADVAERLAYDFREGKDIADGIENNGDDFDHCFVVNGESGTLRHVATLTDPDSGRTMTIESTEPGVQFYTAKHLEGKPENNGYQKRAACCLETNHYPNSPNVSDFPSTILKPGEKYTQTTVHTFGIVEEE